MEYRSMTPDDANPALLARMVSLSSQLVTDLPADLGAREREILDRALRYAAETEQRIANQLARIATLESLSCTDALTGLLNRRGFEQQLRRSLARARRYGETGIIGICDLDAFKSVNDTYGHCAGDRLLCCAAETLASAVRETDVVARLGGDEFAFLLVNTGWQDARKRVQTLQWQFDGAGIVHRGHDVPLSVSIGAEPYGPQDTVEDLMHRADMAMYYTKRQKHSGIAHDAAE